MTDTAPFRAVRWLIGPMTHPPHPDRSDNHLFLVVAVAVTSIWLDTKHNFRPPHAEDVWTLSVYGVLPLMVVVWWELGRKLEGKGLALLGTLCVLSPIFARLLSEDWGKARAKDTAPILVPMIVGALLLLAASWRGKVDLSRWGLSIGDWRWWVPRFLMIAAVLELGVLVAAYISPEMRAYYPEHKPARTDAWELAKYQSSLGIYMLGWEAFFRGFLLFGLARRGDLWLALFTMAFPFFLLHWHKPEIEMLLSFVGSVAAGWLCLRAGSFLPVFGLHWIMNLGMELTCFLWRQAEAGGP